MGDYESRERSKQATRATAGPSADDRFGAGPVGANMQSRLLAVSVEGGRTRVTMSRGKTHGVHVGMEGYIRAIGGMLCDFQVDAVEDRHCRALVEVTADQLRNLPVVILNPTTMPKRVVTQDVTARVIGVAVEGDRTKITIGRGSADGVAAGMRGHLAAVDGREGEDFTIVGATVRQSFAFVRSTVDHVNQHPSAIIHPEAWRAGAAIQRRANGVASPGTDVQSTAQSGVAGASSPLPHADVIQRAFGKHDISGVRSQVGGAASDAAAALGAQAYATGDKVAFASAPDLHTAAHEAAHVVQQRNGVVMRGLGAADDAHEQAADVVADIVASGKSAEPVLDQMVGSSTRGSESAASVQRKTTPTSSSSQVTTDEIARSGSPDTAPGRSTRVDDANAPAVYNVLTPEERAKKVTDLRFRIAAGSARSDIAIAKLEILTLLKKPEDMNIALSLIYDSALTAITMWVGKSISALRNNRAATHAAAEDAALAAGDMTRAQMSAAERAAILSITDDDIRLHVGTLSGFARFQGRASVAAALADTSDKRETLAYLPQLQKQMGKAFQQLSEGIDQLSDAEVIVLHHAMDSDNTTTDAWYRSYEAKTKRWKEAGVDRIGHDRNILESRGKGDWIGHEDIERKVVWVVHEDRVTRSLWFYESSQAHLPVTHLRGRADAWRLTRPVPHEFWNQAVMLSEERHGEPVGELPDSAMTRKARGVSSEAVRARPTSGRSRTKPSSCSAPMETSHESCGHDPAGSGARVHARGFNAAGEARQAQRVLPGHPRCSRLGPAGARGWRCATASVVDRLPPRRKGLSRLHERRDVCRERAGIARRLGSLQARPRLPLHRAAGARVS